jgi:hypothetical protein
MSDPVWFRRGSDNQLLLWRSQHMHDGYIINKDGAKWKLHTPACERIFENPLSKGQSLTSYTKICSTSISRLEDEAQKDHGTILYSCTYPQKKFLKTSYRYNVLRTVLFRGHYL